MNGFKSGKTSVLIATDVAARGIDVSDIDYVFNYDIPQDIEYYVHRIGRTGRAGKFGTAVTLCGGRRQTSQLMNVAKTVKTYIKPMEMPSEEEILKRQYTVNLEHMCALLNQQNTPEMFLQMVNDLKQKGYDAEQIASAALFHQFSQKLNKPVLNEPEPEAAHTGRNRKKQNAKNVRSNSKKTNVGHHTPAHGKRNNKSPLRPTPPPDYMPEISYVGGYNHSRG